MQSEYNEIPGVYSETPRSFLGIRRFYRTYKWCIGAVAFVIGVIILAALLSVLIGSSIEKEEKSVASEYSSENRSNENRNRLMNNKWPRKDENFYKNRWNASHMRRPFDTESDSSIRIKRQTPPEVEDDSTFPENDTFNWMRTPSELPPFPGHEIGYTMDASDKLCMIRRQIEDNIYSNNITLKRNSPSYYHQKGFMKTNPRALKMSQKGYKMDHATKLMKEKLNLDKETSTFDAYWLGELKGSPYCTAEDENFVPPCPENSKYRTADGSCNNVKHPWWGAAFSTFRRIMPPDYSDGIYAPRKSRTRSELPSARLVSSNVHFTKHRNSHFSTQFAMTWGQFIDHDLTATAQGKGRNGESLTCCSDNVKNDPNLYHPECFPIEIPEDDTFFRSKNQTCMEFVRSASASRCSFGPRQQINQLTHFLDASTIYGSTSKQQSELRTYSNGLLKTQITTDGRSLLAPSLNLNDSCNTAQQMLWKQYCFKSGDSRVNEHVLLTVLHTLWMRQHNLVAGHLLELNPFWDDEKLFQETRRIVIAQIQHITYREFLPSVIGPQLSKRLHLEPQILGTYFKGYRENIHPGIGNGFAAAAFRFGHSMIQGLVQSIDETGKNVKFEQLKKFYFNPFSIYDPKSLSGFVRGEASQMCAAADTYFTNQVTDHLFQTKDSSFGLDLVALNIQRARDHGIPGYLRWRMMCGLPVAKNFSDLILDMDEGALAAITDVYEDIQDIDLFSGGLAELPLKDALVGPTFACIIADQFIRLKIGDRFWYENENNPYPFTKGQLKEIHKTTLARILCDNILDLNSMQRWTMVQFDGNNPRYSCSQETIPNPDFDEWEEGGLMDL